MFTGIVSDGFIVSILPDAEGWELIVDAPKFGSIVQLGDSVAIDGACLTVFKIDGNHLSFFVSTESIDKTIIKNYKVGTKINMELPMQPSGYLGGHYVLGHVDTTATCKIIAEKNGSWEFTFEFDPSFASLIIEKGSIAINGISLTLFNVGNNTFNVAIIPYTYNHTNISKLIIEDKVNIEFDMIGKYVNRFQMINKEK